MDEYRIDRLTWQEFDRRRQEVHTVVLPMGATEGYGPHLPLGSDTLVARAVARLVCERTGAFLGPTLPVGDSRSISMFPGTLTVRPESFKEYLRDILDSLLGWGMRNFLFLRSIWQKNRSCALPRSTGGVTPPPTAPGSLTIRAIWPRATPANAEPV